MAVFVVTWNLNKERSNYSQARDQFIKHLERYSNISDAGLESVRWIASTSSADEISTDLQTKLDSNDRIFVSKLSNSTHEGWLNQKTWDWIKQNM
jgi:hypothetical protein